MEREGGQLIDQVRRGRETDEVCTYPDSVRRVRPPNTTIPKTLAALPKSQYATLLALVSGKELDLDLELLFESDLTVSSLRVGDGPGMSASRVLATGACLLALLLLLRLKEVVAENTEAA